MEKETEMGGRRDLKMTPWDSSAAKDGKGTTRNRTIHIDVFTKEQNRTERKYVCFLLFFETEKI